MKNSLPTGWEITKIADVFAVNPGHTGIEIADDDEVSFVPMPEIEQETGKLNATTYRAYREIKKGYTKFVEGDVLFAKITPCMENGKIAIASGLVNGLGCGTTEVFVFRQQGAGLAKYLFYYLVQKSFRRYAKSKFNGAVGHLRVPSSIFEELTFPLPPLAEQKRIVAQLDALTQKLEASQERLEKLPELLEKFRQAVLAAAVSGKLTKTWREKQSQGESAPELLDRIRAERRTQWEEKQRIKMKGKQLSLNDSWKQKYDEPAAPDITELPELPEGWTYTSLLNVSNRITDGTHQPPTFVKEGIPFVFVKHIVNGAIDFTDTRFISLSEYEELNSRCPVEVGDILYSAVGSYGVAVPVETAEPFSFQRHIAHIKPTGSVLTNYVVYFLNSVIGLNQAHKVARGVAQKTVTLGELSKFTIPVPSIAEQQEIVHQVNHYFALADQLEARFEQAAAMVEQLPQALLAKAFSGQLVPQDPDDEPASVLLERLRAPLATPAAQAKGKPGRKAKAPAKAPLFD